MLAVGIVLTIGTGIFVASEFALVNLERSDLEAGSGGANAASASSSAH